MIRVTSFCLAAVAATAISAAAWAEPGLTHSTARVVTTDTQPTPMVRMYELDQTSGRQVLLVMRDGGPTDRVELRIAWKTIYIDPWKDYTKMGHIDPNHFIPRAQRLWHSMVTNRAHVICGSPAGAAVHQAIPQPRMIFEKPQLPKPQPKQDAPKVDEPKQVIYQMACAG